MLDIRFTNTKAMALRLQAGSSKALLEQLNKRLGTGPCVYANEPAVLDFSHWSEAELQTNPPDLEALSQALNAAKIKWVEVRSAYLHGHFESQAEALGLRYEKTQASQGKSHPNAEAAPSNPTPNNNATSDSRRTMVIEQAVRSGQKVYAHNADLVVMGPVSAGAEVIADGNIHVYGLLRGRALAGAAGDTQAKIMSTCFEPELVAVAGYYLTFEAGFAEDNRAKPILVFLDQTQAEPTLGLKTINIR